VYATNARTNSGGGMHSTLSTLPGQTKPGQTPGINSSTNSTESMTKSATQKASRDDIRQFGQKIVDDHTKASDQLKEVPGDKAFVKDQLKDHQAEIGDFRAEAQAVRMRM
jgi:Domain of unknown function (DUF4142)